MPRLLLTWLLVAANVSTALAGGFEYPANGTAALGRGGAFAARADDLTAIEYNPAGLLKIPGNMFYLGDNITLHQATFTPYTLTGAEQPAVENDAGPFWTAPVVGASTDLGLENWRFAIGAYGPSSYGKSSFGADGIDRCFGMTGTDSKSSAERDECFADPALSHRHMMVSTDFLMAYYTISTAYGRKDRWGVGVSLHWVDLIRSKYTLFVNAATPKLVVFGEEMLDVEATLDVADHVNFAATIGAWWKPVKSVELAFSARVPPVNFEATGSTRLRFQDSLLARVYAQETDAGDAEGLLSFDNSDKATTGAIPTTLRFSYPMTARMGIRYSHLVGAGDHERELFDVEFDTVWDGWSVLESFDVELEGYMQMHGSGVSNADKLSFKPMSIPKRYKDTWSFRLGGQYSPVDWLVLRSGGYYETGAVPNDYSHLDFASFDRFGASGGASFKVSNLTLSLAYSHIFQQDRDVSAEETGVYRQYPLVDEQPRIAENAAGAGRFETSYDVFSAAVAYAF